MTQEDKKLLLKDLCARLPYGVRIKRETITGSYARVEFTLSLETFDRLKIGIQEDRYSIKPYLRPMSSMTEEEKKEFYEVSGLNCYDGLFTCKKLAKRQSFIGEVLDWLNAHYFDYRGLIEKGLAIETPEDMYKTE